MDERDSRGWPEWGEPLRPDDVARARMRRGIRERSAPLLARRRGGAWRVLEAWAGYLAPLAAATAIFCAWAAVQEPAGDPGAGAGPAVGAPTAGAPDRAPGVLVSEIGTRGERVVESSFLAGL